jgi:hypothetical protein
MKVRNNEVFEIEDIFVPIYDERLDFLMLEPKRVNNGKPLKKNQETFLGYALLVPTKQGLVDSTLMI